MKLKAVNVTNMRHFNRYIETMNTKQSPSRSVGLRLSNEYADKLNEIAKSKNTGTSTLARLIVEKWIDEYTKNNA